MALLQRADLQYDYSWNAIPPDDPRVTGKPDSTFLNRGEGYEVLPFINRIAKGAGWVDKSLGLKVERLLIDHLPGNIRSHDKIHGWLRDNWNEYK